MNYSVLRVRTNGILDEVRRELILAAEKHGPQLDLPMFHEFGHEVASGQSAKFTCESRSELGEVTWADIALEEVAEAFNETEDLSALRAELLQSAAMFVAWVRALDSQEERRKNHMRHLDSEGLPCPGLDDDGDGDCGVCA